MNTTKKQLQEVNATLFLQLQYQRYENEKLRNGQNTFIRLSICLCIVIAFMSFLMLS